jgi:hypothetical protein
VSPPAVGTFGTDASVRVAAEFQVHVSVAPGLAVMFAVVGHVPALAGVTVRVRVE